MLVMMLLPLNKNSFRLIFFLLVFGLIKSHSLAQTNKFKKKLPDHIKLQYAGGIGFLSIGAGYSNKKDKLEGDLFYGYLPRSIGGVRINSLSGKFTWIPYHLLVRNKYKLEPLMMGLLINYNFGRQYFGFDPDKYPYRYYSFPTAINTAIFAGSGFDLNKPGRLSFYYEVLCFDRDLLSLVDNPKSLNISDVLTLSFGVKINVK